MALVVALHGDFASGDLLRRDMGDPSWVNRFPTWRSRSDIELPAGEPTVLIGYSSGADMVRRLLAESVFSGRRNVVAAIGYEPLTTEPLPVTSVPLLVIGNRLGRWRWTPAGRLYRQRWIDAGAAVMTGRGTHVRATFAWPPVAHAWDQSLNEAIRSWILEVTRE